MRKLYRYRHGKSVSRLFYMHRFEAAERWMLRKHMAAGISLSTAAKIAVSKFNLA